MDDLLGHHPVTHRRTRYAVAHHAVTYRKRERERGEIERE